jgi:hypothetical protein
MKTIYGIQQKQDGLRRAAYIIHCSLVQKPAQVERLWPLPLDEDQGDITRNKYEEYKLLKAQINGN